MLNGRVFGFIFLLIFILGCSETQEKFYPNVEAAKKDGAIGGGWIPNIIPETASEIYERHNLDTNRVWLRFKFDKKDIKELIAQIEEVKPNEITAIEFSAPNVRWWPKDVNKDSLTKGQQLGLKLYKYKRVLQYGDNRQKTVLSFFIIDWNSNVAYYWQYSS